MVKVHTSIVTPPPPLNGMLVHRRVTSSSMSPVPIYTPGWRGTKWSKVPCLRKQRDERGLNHGTPKDFKAISQGESFNSAWKKWMNSWLTETISTCVFHFEKVLRSLDQQKRLTFCQNFFFSFICLLTVTVRLKLTFGRRNAKNTNH